MASQLSLQRLSHPTPQCKVLYLLDWRRNIKILGLFSKITIILGVFHWLFLLVHHVFIYGIIDFQRRIIYWAWNPISLANSTRRIILSNDNNRPSWRVYIPPLCLTFIPWFPWGWQRISSSEFYSQRLTNTRGTWLGTIEMATRIFKPYIPG